MKETGTKMRSLHTTELRLALEAVQWVEATVIEGTPPFAWLSSVQVTDPESGRVVGAVVWVDDAWAFETTP